ncbi:N-acetylmuramoyl-L-alanine amidase [Ventosimonas gracilis]|uniref:N-acetylmuramoyl-L-alanine amidase AmiC n=1 Tax=Ventosimonas gracilis TaxID=1680762 RepID=A0A139SVU1_9GAMM|nr:N-acetylmuramoyl-L-alanine amidase [Ventosimonas gracilis]KXU38726.1 N-acetylmuramoyl-L-alanine amidase [Ventosimonas gracilis]
MKAWTRTLGLIALLLLPLTALAEAQIQSVRLWRAPDNTRLVLDLSAAVKYEVLTLDKPLRVVIDMKDAQLATQLDGLSLGGTPIRALRSGRPSSDILRLVIDLSAEVKPSSFSLPPNAPYGHRLVIDLFDQLPQTQVAPNAPPPTNSSPTVSLPSGQRDIVIAIDAGHGGEDPGALGAKGQHEKHVTLAIARELQRQINQRKGFRGELTRSGDYFIPLVKRPLIARQKGADLFVSIHADAAERKSAFGASVYALSKGGASSETARWLAKNENRSDLIGGVDRLSLNDKDPMLAGVLLDLSMNAKLASSLNVGDKVLSSMGKVTALHKRSVETAGFIVLKSPDMPSILVETGFISNQNEAQKLNTAQHQRTLASAIAKGIFEFFQKNPPPGSWLAFTRDGGQSVATAAREHRVQAGESLSQIARRYQVSTAALRQHNALKSDLIKVGQILKIPAL